MALLDVNSLRWAVPGGDILLRDVDLTIEAGDRVAIVGASGSGKSTLLRCLVALESYDGTVLHRGRTVGPDSVLALRRDVVYLAQTPARVGETVQDNLEFARNCATNGLELETQNSLLDRFGLAGIPADRSFDRLSVGERQRLCFVRAMTLEPSVLLLDEPTSALDADNVEILESMVSDWLTGDHERAAVWVTHDDEQADRVASRRLRLTGGQLEEDA